MQRILIALVSALISWLPVVAAAGNGDPEWKTDLQSYLDRAGEAIRSTAEPRVPPTLRISDYGGCYDNPVFGRVEVRVEGDEVGGRFHDTELAVEHLHDDVFMLSNSILGDVAATFSVTDGTVSSVSMPLGSPQRERVFVRGAGSCTLTAPGRGSVPGGIS